MRGYLNDWNVNLNDDHDLPLNALLHIVLNLSTNTVIYRKECSCRSAYDIE